MSNKPEQQTGEDVTCYGDPIVKGVTHAQIEAIGANKIDLDSQLTERQKEGMNESVWV